MTEPTRHQNDLQIRRLLMEGDPADDGRDPDPVELSSWRRRALAATWTGRQPGGWHWRLLPLATMAAAAIVAVIFALLPQAPVKLPEPATMTRNVPADGVVTAPVAVPAPPIFTQGDTREPDARLLVQDQMEPALSPAVQPHISVSSSPSPPAGVAVTTRTVHFTAPGGTRVIWTLNPELQLPTLGGSI